MGITTIENGTIFKSPAAADRENAKEIIGQADFHEIYVSCPLDVCEERDAKGFYKLARKGVIELVSGTSRGIRLKGDTLRSLHAAQGGQFVLPLPSLAQLTLPLIGRVAAGSPILAQEHVDQTYHVESSLFQHKPDYLLKVRGMSMRDIGIIDGDLLAVQSTREARNGQIVVARLGEEVTVKRYRRTPHAIELHAENPDYPTIIVEPGEPFAIEGLAVGLIRNTMLM